jgi:hypothetical protein
MVVFAGWESKLGHSNFSGCFPRWFHLKVGVSLASVGVLIFREFNRQITDLLLTSIRYLGALMSIHPPPTHFHSHHLCSANNSANKTTVQLSSSAAKVRYTNKLSRRLMAKLEFHWDH